MTHPTQTILIVDSNPVTRTRLASELATTGCEVLEAADGRQALEIVRQRKVRLVVSELFLRTSRSECLIKAIRQNRMHGTRTLAHTSHGTLANRKWAKTWGASGFLIQPTQTERLQYVVAKLLDRPTQSSTASVRTSRRDSLSGALAEIERGDLAGTTSVVVGRSWWEGLSGSERNSYRRRARSTGVSLRSDAMMGAHFVELRRAPNDNEGSTPAAANSPYLG